MATSHLSEVVQHLRRAALLRDGTDLTDGQLLEGFISRREEAALEALVQRHGRMVWGVCRRVLRDHHDAEDAFQATFLVLVRKAASIVPREMVGNWLYGVANQTALKAKATIARRQGSERQVAEMPEPTVPESDRWRDLQWVLDEELCRLPDKYRVVILLCDLEGKTRKEVARQLGCPEGTVAGRLTRGRAMLAKRLARRGLAVSGATLAGMLAQNAVCASAPPSVVASIIQSVSVAAKGGIISANAAALAEGVVKAMFLNQLKSALTMILIILGLGIATFGVGVLAQGQSNRQPPDLNVVAKERDGQAEIPKEAGPPPAQPKQEPAKADPPNAPALAQQGQKVFIQDPPPSYAASLISNKKVQEELGLGSEQIKGVFAAVRKVREEKYKDDFAELDAKREKLDQPAVSDAAHALYAKVDKDNLKAIGDVLKPEQMKRFKQIQFQRRLENLGALLEPDVAKELLLTDKQKKLVASIRSQWQQDVTAAAFRQNHDRIYALHKEAMDVIRKSLNDEQKKKLEALTGKPFAFPQPGATPGNPGAPGAPAVPAQADGKLGHIKVEARGRMIAKKNKDGSTPYFLRVEQNKPAPAVEFLIRTKFDKATVIRHVLDLKDTEVILTGNLAWLPKGARTDTDDDYTLGFVIQEKAQLERLDPKDKSPHYVKLEARGDGMIQDNSLVVLVQLHEKPAKRVFVSGSWRAWGLDRLTAVLKTKQVTIAGHATWEPRTDLVILRLHAPQLVDPPLDPAPPK